MYIAHYFFRYVALGKGGDMFDDAWWRRKRSLFGGKCAPNHLSNRLISMNGKRKFIPVGFGILISLPANRPSRRSAHQLSDFLWHYHYFIQTFMSACEQSSIYVRTPIFGYAFAFVPEPFLLFYDFVGIIKNSLAQLNYSIVCMITTMQLSMCSVYSWNGHVLY